MYDMYPDWGPAAHDPSDPRSAEALARAFEARDVDGDRPDDN